MVYQGRSHLQDQQRSQSCQTVDLGGSPQPFQSSTRVPGAKDTEATLVNWDSEDEHPNKTFGTPIPLNSDPDRIEKVPSQRNTETPLTEESSKEPEIDAIFKRVDQRSLAHLEAESTAEIRNFLYGEKNFWDPITRKEVPPSAPVLVT
ncbi:hypothetical protein PtA15_15A389 [Puccinia triticina]|uniref:AGC-kinase C-terminal domain-containing protein n=1 Tax=Puccinia triticina TaxID=208348 RepID=A0ABY7D3K8_9BASI|nr:uncharacterized protein PtA15_15A389 [Puccinia triticina]WAQ91996.1 hypothetical protein PtA15_15A389 [Puccinia triticina]